MICWRHPDALPDWSATEKQTADGRAFLPLQAGVDAALDPKPASALAETGDGTGLCCRAAMGLTASSPVSKRDSMELDYLPVHEGEDSDDGTATAVQAPPAETLRAAEL